MDETHDIPETVTLRVGSTPIAGGDRYAVEVEVEAPARKLLATAPEGGGMLFRRDSRERPGVVSEWKFGEGSGRVNVDVLPTIRMDGRDMFIGTITLVDACELLHVLRVLETGGWHLAGDAAMEARWVAGESLEPGDFVPAVVPEIPHAGPATPNATPEMPEPFSPPESHLG